MNSSSDSRLLSGFAVLAFVLTAIPVRAAVTLTESADDTRTYSVKCQLKVEGTVQTAAPEGKSVTLKTSVNGKLTFLERRLPAGGRDAEALRSIRYYEVADADISVGERQTVHQLNNSLRQVVAECRRDGVRVYSTTTPMTYDAVELLRTPGDSLPLAGLLPVQAVEKGDTWKPGSWVLPALTGVEAVSEVDLTCTLESLDNQYAVIAFEGRVAGAVLGAATKVEAKGKVAYDLQKKHIRQAVLTQKEDRAVGAVSPGVHVTATMQIDKSPSAVSGPLTDKALSAVPIVPEAQQLALWFDTGWGPRFAYERNWHVFHQDGTVVVLRLVENGSLIAQCNVSKMPTLSPGQATPIDQFQSDIRTSLGAGLKAIVTAEQTKNADGVVLYRVIVTGESRQVPMHWLYYLSIAPDGRQTAFVFAVESQLVEQLNNRDREIVETVLFVNRANPAAAKAGR